MDRKSKATAQGPSVRVATHWHTGLRTPSWEELWDRIFRDVLAEVQQPYQNNNHLQGIDIHE
jgi:hypothetical protein